MAKTDFKKRNKDSDESSEAAQPSPKEAFVETKKKKNVKKVENESEESPEQKKAA